MGNINIIKGNLFNTKAQTIVNTVNCVGVMGKGIALVFKLRYPKMFDIYQNICSQNLMEIGKLWLYKGETNKPWVLNFPTKTHWKLPSEYSYIEAGLKKFVSAYKEKGITSIAFPLLGANNGGLEAEKVLTIMQKYLSQCEIPIEIYQYDPNVKDDLFDIFKNKWNLIPFENKKSVFGIRTTNQIETIDECLKYEKVKSLIQLIEYPGIGIKTMEKCFNNVMNY